MSFVYEKIFCLNQYESEPLKSIQSINKNNSKQRIKTTFYFNTLFYCIFIYLHDGECRVMTIIDYTINNGKNTKNKYCKKQSHLVGLLSILNGFCY